MPYSHVAILDLLPWTVYYGPGVWSSAGLRHAPCKRRRVRSTVQRHARQLHERGRVEMILGAVLPALAPDAEPKVFNSKADA